MSQFEYYKELSILLIGAIGGLVDYFNQVQRGEREFGIAGIIIHELSACFFSILMGYTAVGLGYNMEMALAAGGLGGFLGTRLSDLFLAWVNKKY